ncbi:MAG: hypothetical protein JO359_10550 [Candidatus Eremiobacteraeota bacterium]|nr:hypothetical protein [Candidatus Eremiobacteraeota bacterium]
MDITAASSAAAAGTAQTAITYGLITSTENLAAVQADILMASLGLGNNVNAFA